MAQQQHDIDQAKRELKEFYAELLGELLKTAAKPTLDKLAALAQELADTRTSIPSELAKILKPLKDDLKTTNDQLKIPDAMDDNDAETAGSLLRDSRRKLDEIAQSVEELDASRLSADVVREVASSILREDSPLRSLLLELIHAESEALRIALGEASAERALGIRNALDADLRALRERTRTSSDQSGSGVVEAGWTLQLLHDEVAARLAESTGMIRGELLTVGETSTMLTKRIDELETVANTRIARLESSKATWQFAAVIAGAVGLVETVIILTQMH